MNLSEIQKRLDEIAATNLQDLPDDTVLALLAERKKLLAEQIHLQETEDQQKKEVLMAQLAEINKSITPDQDDEKLLALIQQRKVLEAELKAITAGPEAVKEESREESAPAPEEIKPVEKKEIPIKKPEFVPAQEQAEAPSVAEAAGAEESVAPVVPESVPEVSPKQSIPTTKSEKNTIDPTVAYTKTYVSDTGKISQLEPSAIRIGVDPTLEGSEYQGYLRELKENLNSLGTFLQALPVEAKRNRAFMLEVANIDPAYAMHYADKDTLKKDEAFNIAIAGMNNQRNTGNPFSEMLPEMRTGPVLLAGVKNDFRNVRFLRPEMPEYEEILALAQKGALEAVASLKDAHDIQFLLPPILQKDKTFMAKVQEITKSP